MPLPVKRIPSFQQFEEIAMGNTNTEMLGAAVLGLKMSLDEKTTLHAQLAQELQNSKREKERLANQLEQMQVGFKTKLWEYLVHCFSSKCFMVGSKV